ncbi:MAG: M48 family metalloprotease [Robiginitomaculum sp.]|nr:M48 family metalloprotease [Robiginitomaculum sp.]
MTSTPSFAQFRNRIVIPEQAIIETYDQQAIEIGITLNPAIPGFIPGDIEPINDKLFARLQVSQKEYPKMMKVMNSFIEQLAKVGPRPDIVPQIAIERNAAPNAYTPREDLIVVTSGLLNLLLELDTSRVESRNIQTNRTAKDSNSKISDEDRKLSLSEDHALVFILAHEYAHILLAHPSRYRKQEDATKVGTPIAGALVLLKKTGGIANTLGINMGQEYYQATDVLTTALVISPWLESELYRASFVPYQRKEEMKADFLGADIISKTGKYDIEKGANPLRRIYKIYGDEHKRRLRETKKNVEEQMRAAAKDAAALGAKSLLGNGMNFGKTLKNRVINRGIGKAFSIIEDRRKKKPHLYHSSDKRVGAIDKYVIKFGYEHPPALTSPSLWGGYFEEENKPEKIARAALDLLALNDVEAAKKVLLSLPKSANQSDYLYLYAQGKVASSEGEHQQAVNFYLKAIKITTAPLLGYVDLVEAATVAEDRKNAFLGLDAAARKFGENEVIILRIRTHGNFEEYEQAQQVLLLCQDFNDEDLLKQCNENMPIAPQEDDGEENDGDEKEKKRFGIPKIIKNPFAEE